MLNNPYQNHHFIFLDLETTGGSATSDRITEIAWIEVLDGEIIAEGQTLINPETPIPPWIVRLTGINQAMVAAAPKFAEIADDLAGQLHGKILVAHNARFDYGFLKNEFKRAGIDFSVKVLCSVKFSRKLYPEFSHHGLDHIIERFQLTVENRHRAMTDAQLIWQFFQRCTEHHDAEQIRQTLRSLLKMPSLPSYLDKDQLNAIPDTPGVYHFLGEGGKLLYVGKSVQLRSRVLSHFSGDHSSAKDLEMSQSIRDVKWIATAGDFSAQLLESRQIKLLSPFYNRRLRKTQILYHLQLGVDSAGYLILQIKAGVDFLAADLSQIFGLFRTKLAAENKLRELAVAYRLCHRLTGLEVKKSGSCFAYQLKKCLGACCGKEPLDAYNQRVQEALAPLQYQVWPWPGSIVVTDTDAASGRQQLHLINKWSHLGSADDREQLQAINASTPLTFDLDTYKILLKFLMPLQAGISVQPFV